MSKGKLVNAFGDITLESTQVETRDLLVMLLLELKIMNTHLAEMTDIQTGTDELDYQQQEYGR